MAKYQRAGGAEEDANTHTEYSRLLAEHGVLGVIALTAVVVIVVQSIAWSTTVWNRFATVAAQFYALFTMSHSATRIAITAVMFGLGCLRVAQDEAVEESTDQVRATSEPEPLVPVVPIARQPLRIRARR